MDAPFTTSNVGLILVRHSRDVKGGQELALNSPESDQAYDMGKGPGTQSSVCTSFNRRGGPLLHNPSHPIPLVDGSVLLPYTQLLVFKILFDTQSLPEQRHHSMYHL